MTGIRYPETVGIGPVPKSPMYDFPATCGVRLDPSIVGMPLNVTEVFGVGALCASPQRSTTTTSDPFTSEDLVVLGRKEPSPQWASQEDVEAYQQQMGGWRPPYIEVSTRYLDVMKLDPQAILPTKNHEDDAGYDLYALSDMWIEPETIGVVLTGIAMDIPRGYVGLVWPRSGMAVKRKTDVFAGVIDAGYRGDVSVCLYNTHKRHEANGGYLEIKKGDRVGQILIQEIPKFTIREVPALNESARGTKGYGSSGR